MVAYVGTYTRQPRRGDGILVYWMDPTSGAWEWAQTVKSDNPSFLAFDRDQRYLYAVNEIRDYLGKTDGSVSAYAIDPTTGKLGFLNAASSGGHIPAHLTADPTNRYILVSNYSAGTNAVLPINADGSLGEPTDVVRHSAELGLGSNTQRQEAPHPHAIPFDPSGRYVYVPDLGLDRTFIYRLVGNKLVPNSAMSWAMASSKGAGPRHIAFHPAGTYAYVINELNSTIDVFGLDPVSGVLVWRQTVPTLPGDFRGTSTTAEVVVAPSGQFLYGSNRGHNSLAIYWIDQSNGLLTPLGWESTQGEIPRNFNIDPTGTWLYAANQNTDTIVTYGIDQSSGKLWPTGQVIKTNNPVCIIFAS
jgi:6-phosphogluconolactonase